MPHKAWPKQFRIGERTVGEGAPCYVIAEAGVNHNGSVDQAHALIDAAADAGADAVKFQTFKAEKVIAASAPKAAYQEATTGVGESQLDMVRKLELAPEAHAALAEHCAQRGIHFLSTPFDIESVELLASLRMPAFKIPSGEVTNLPFVGAVAAKGAPVILSTGMAWLSEVEEAVRTLDAAGCEALAVLQCTSNYPAAAEDTNLRAMATMATALGVPTGYSDHTLGIEVSIGAVALGACIVEKHFTLDRTLPGPDHRASLEPSELRAMAAAIRNVEAALGDGIKRPAASEANTASVARRSIVATRALAEGTVLEDEMLTLKRPGTGLPPAMLPLVLGRKLRRAVARDAILTMGDIA